MLVIIILAIAIPLALRPKDQQPDNPEPIPKPVPPYVPIDEDNPYSVEKDSIVETQSVVKGIIRSPKDYKNTTSINYETLQRLRATLD